MRWAWHVARVGNNVRAISILVRRPEEKTQLGRRRVRWEDDIEMGVQEMGWGAMDWIELVQVRDSWRALVNAVMNFRVP